MSLLPRPLGVHDISAAATFVRAAGADTARFGEARPLYQAGFHKRLEQCRWYFASSETPECRCR